MLISRQTAKFITARAALLSVYKKAKLFKTQDGKIWSTWAKQQASIWESWTRLDRDLVSTRLHSLAIILERKTTERGCLAALVSTASVPWLVTISD